MKAMVMKAPRELRVEDIPEFPIRADEVTVEVRACGVCGSDLRYYQGENPWAQHTLGRFEPNPPNIVLGHEFCGIVVDGHRDLLGKRVAVMPLAVCGECPQCRDGYNNLCVNMKHLGHGGGWGDRDYYPGGMAERCPVWASSCFVLPDNLSDIEAALMDMLGVAVHAISLREPGPVITVIGAGPIGLSIAQVARSRGADRVLMFDPSPTAREVAALCGIEEVFDVAGGDIAAALGRVRDLGGATTLYDTVGRSATLRAGVEALRFGGQVIVMAAHDDLLPFSMMELGQERSLRTSCNFVAPVDFQTAIQLASSGRVKLGPYVTKRVALDDAPEAFGRMTADRSWAFKCVVCP